MIIADVDLELLRGKEYEFHEWLDRKLAQVRAEERQRCIEAIRKAHHKELCDVGDCIEVIKELE